MSGSTLALVYRAVRSSNLRAVAYDAATRTLGVQFTNGTEYHYADIPPEVHAALIEADSLGHAFHRLIRSTYTGTRVHAPR